MNELFQVQKLERDDGGGDDGGNTLESDGYLRNRLSLLSFSLLKGALARDLFLSISK